MGHPYELGVDNSDATVVTTYLAFAAFVVLIVLLSTPRTFGLSSRYPTIDGDIATSSTLLRIEDKFGRYIVVASFQGLSILCHGIIRSAYPHTLDYTSLKSDAYMAGYNAFGRLSAFFFSLSAAALSDAAMRRDIISNVADNTGLVIILRIVGSVWLILAVVSLAIEPDENGLAYGIVLVVAAIPPLISAVLAMKNYPSTQSIFKGRFFIVCSMIAIIITGIWLAAWENECSVAYAREQGQCDICPFEDDLNHNFFANIFLIISVILLGIGLLQFGSEISQDATTTTMNANLSPVPKGDETQSVSKNAVDTNKDQVPKPGTTTAYDDRTDPVPASDSQPAYTAETDQQKVSTPDAARDPDDQHAQSQTYAQDTKLQSVKPTAEVATASSNENTKSDTERSPDTVPNDPAPIQSVTLRRPEDASPSIVSAGGNANVEDSVLKKMYDLFTAADSGAVDVADANLSSDEFSATISVSKLEEVLKPIGGLDLSRVDPTLNIAAGVPVPLDLVFNTLDQDKNGQITASEFLKLLRQKASGAYSTIIEDGILAKLYKLFTAADSGVVDIADAGLTEYEFKGTISVAKLQAVLSPIGGLNLERIDPSIKDTKPVDISTVFKVLDKDSNDRVTATEFIKLLKTSLPAAHAAGHLLQA